MYRLVSVVVPGQSYVIEDIEHMQRSAGKLVVTSDVQTWNLEVPTSYRGCSHCATRLTPGVPAFALMGQKRGHRHLCQSCVELICQIASAHRLRYSAETTVR